MNYHLIDFLLVRGVIFSISEICYWVIWVIWVIMTATRGGAIMFEEPKSIVPFSANIGISISRSLVRKLESCLYKSVMSVPNNAGRN